MFAQKYTLNVCIANNKAILMGMYSTNEKVERRTVSEKYGTQRDGTKNYQK